MTNRDRDRDHPQVTDGQVDYPPSGRQRGADTRQALWSCAVAAAFVVILGVTLYGISTQRDAQTAARPPATSEQTPPALAGVPAPETTGQGGSGNRPADDDQR